MDNTPTSISQRITRLKRLVKEYFLLADGALIESHQQLLRVFDIRASKHKKSHPHKGKRVYISRKSLKHYVESRKRELSKNHLNKEVLEKILFGIDNMQEVVIHFDRYELEPPSHAYIKDYSNVGCPSLRIMLDIKDGHLEIRSIHFTKIRKKLDN